MGGTLATRVCSKEGPTKWEEPLLLGYVVRRNNCLTRTEYSVLVFVLLYIDNNKM